MELAEVGKQAGLSAGILVLLLLLAVDARKAMKRRIHWVPGKALVLSALTVQLLTLLTSATVSSSSSSSSSSADRLLLHIGRVMICVFVGNLVPVMARAASKSYRTRLIALLLTVSFQVASEMYAINFRRQDDGEDGGQTLSNVTTVTVLGSMMLLLMLLSSATLASKSIYDLMRQKVPVILETPFPVTWQAVEDHVLRCWIVAKLCHPEYVLARSALVAAAGVIVSACVLVSVVGWSVQGHGQAQDDGHDPVSSALRYTAIGLQCGFIVAGWTVICWRWLSAVLLYGTGGRRGTWQTQMQVEDFWTRRIIDQLYADERALSGGRHRVLKVRPVRRRMWLPAQLLPLAVAAQYGVVLFSKCCWLISDAVFCNSYMLGRLLGTKLRALAVDADYPRFRASVEAMRLPSETTEGLWLAVRESVRQAKVLAVQGYDEGRRCSVLVRFLSQSPHPDRRGLRLLGVAGGAAAAAAELKFVMRRDPARLRAEESFALLGRRRRSWKLTAVTALRVAVAVSGAAKPALEAADAYEAAWEIMDVVDDAADPQHQAESYLLSRAADVLFLELRAELRANRWVSFGEASAGAVVGMMADAARVRADGAGAGVGADSLDWRELAAAVATYRLCAGMATPEDAGRDEVAAELVACVADVMEGAVLRAAEAVTGNCARWAVELQNKHVWKCVYVAAKLRAVMEALQLAPSPQPPQQQQQLVVSAT